MSRVASAPVELPGPIASWLSSLLEDVVLKFAFGLVASIGAAAIAAVAAAAGTPAALTEAYLNKPENITAGKAVWEEQCRHCHGSSAYPGKGPKLKPRRYKPGFVYDRVTNGFRKMPAWKEIYSDEERMAVVAYILSRKFSP